MWTIWYNGDCSKSRAAKTFLDERNIEYRTINYLETPLTSEMIKDLLAKIGVGIDGIIRAGEAEFKAISGEWFTWSDDKKIEFVIQNPIILQRPLVVHGDKGVIARPGAEEIERIL